MYSNHRIDWKTSIYLQIIIIFNCIKMVTQDIEYLPSLQYTSFIIRTYNIINLQFTVSNNKTSDRTREQTAWRNRPRLGDAGTLSSDEWCGGEDTIKFTDIILCGTREGSSLLKYHIIIMIILIRVCRKSRGRAGATIYSRFASGRRV